MGAIAIVVECVEVGRRVAAGASANLKRASESRLYSTSCPSLASPPCDRNIAEDARPLSRCRSPAHTGFRR